MIVMGSLALLRPYWLMFIPMLLLFLKFTRSLDLSLGDWPRAIDPLLLNSLIVKSGLTLKGTKNADIIWSVILIIIALSGPAQKVADSNQFRNLDAALIIMNVSSMTNISKMTTAAQIALSGSGARQAGLVLYAGDAYLASPLTYDLASIEALIFAVDNQTVPDGGSHPERALALARKLLQDTQIFAGDVVIIGDGEGINAQALQEARSLARDGHSLHSLFIAENVEDGVRRTVLRAAMMELASEGRGLSGEGAAAEKIAEAIATRRIERVEKVTRLSLEWRDFGRFILGLAVIPLFSLLRKVAE
jgi:Ca-activated chloride channel family protein